MNIIELCLVMFDSLQPQQTIAHQVPLSMVFSRQEYWSGLPCPLLQGIFLTQGSNSSLLFFLQWQVGSLPLVPPGKYVYMCVCVCIYIIKYNYIIVGAQRKETTCPNLIVKTRTGSCMACSWETKIRVCHWNHRVHHVQ